MESLKKRCKSWTYQFNAVVMPVIYLVTENFQLVEPYLGKWSNLVYIGLLIIGNIALREKTARKPSYTHE